MSFTEIISIGKQVGTVLNKLLDQLPTHDQRKMDEFFKLLSRYKEEISRSDADFDDLLAYRERIGLLLDTVIGEIGARKNKN